MDPQAADQAGRRTGAPGGAPDAPLPGVPVPGAVPAPVRSPVPGARDRGEVTLRDEEVELRPWRPSDAPAVHAACQDPEIQRWTSVPSPYTERDAVEFVRDAAPAGWASGGEFTFAVLADGHLVASVGLGCRSGRVVGTLGEVGYWAAPWGRGHGYVTRAVRLLCRWGFEVVGMDRIEWHAEVGNAASRAVAERAGFRFEGVCRSALHHRGAADAWLGALLPGDPPTGIATAPLYPPALRTDRLLLRPLAEGDVDAVAEHCRDPRIQRWLATLPSPYTRADAERFVGGQRGAPWEGRLDLAITTGPGAPLVGVVGLFDVQRRSGQAEVGYWVAPGASGRGLATEAVRALTRWAADGLGVHRVELNADERNTASRRVADKAGFIREGVRRDAMLDRDGQLCTVVCYARLTADEGGAA